MPEMPEVQAMAERLEAAVGGGAFMGAVALQFSGLKTFEPRPESLVGLRVTGVGRRGKFALFEFGGPRIAFHLSQGGRVDVEEPPKTTRPKGAVVRFRFGGRPSILLKEYGTERKAGWWVLAEGDEGPMAVLGPEPFSDEFAALVMEGTDGRRVHTLLRDQRTVAGIGRGYSDDILHRASISPHDSLKSLAVERRTALLEAAHALLEEGLVVERRRTGGLPTKVGDHWVVHGRHGTPCPRCGADLRRVSYEAYEVTYCPECQTGGKILADRRLSRLVR
ncbi:MAG: DNA-formamidopyrimidine glycosylase family protein [Acidimicrobiales bacterium]